MTIFIVDLLTKNGDLTKRFLYVYQGVSTHLGLLEDFFRSDDIHGGYQLVWPPDLVNLPEYLRW